MSHLLLIGGTFHRQLTPADDGTRGYSVYQMTSESRWISGRSFVSKHRSDWPKQQILESQYVKIISFPCSVPVSETCRFEEIQHLEQTNKGNRLLFLLCRYVQEASYNQSIRPLH